MAVGVSARTAFSLLFPAILDEFGWERGMTAGAFSFGFVVSAAAGPVLGRLMDRRGPRAVIELGVGLLAVGLWLAMAIHQPWHLYATLGVLVSVGSNSLGYTAQALYLPHWFVRRRGLAMSLAYAGAGVGAIVVLPWVQRVIVDAGWRAACWALGVLVVALLAPLNLLLKHRPEDIGLQPDGDRPPDDAAVGGGKVGANRAQRAVDWTLGRAMRTAPFWWIAVGYFTALYSWYAVQVHQTRYLLELGFTPADAAWALGLVSLVGIPGQIALGYLSDRIGREWAWTAGNLGFALCFLALLALRHVPTPTVLVLMVLAQGAVGYGLVAVLGAIPADMFGGRHHGTILGTLIVAAGAGGAAGPWLTGVLYDTTGTYAPGFTVGIGCSALSAIAIWCAGPRRARPRNATGSVSQ